MALLDSNLFNLGPTVSLTKRHATSRSRPMGPTRRNDAYIMKHRCERRRPDRRLEFLELEPRMLLAPVYIPPADRSDGTLIAPPVIKSVNGVLKAYVNVVQAGYPSGGSPSVLYGGKPAFSNPDAP